MNYKTFHLLIALFSFCCWTACQPANVPDEADAAIEIISALSLDSLIAKLPGGSEMRRQRDSVFASALPNFLSHPAERRAMAWYEIQTNWREYFGDLGELNIYLQDKAEQFVRNGNYAKGARLYVVACRLNNVESNYDQASAFGDRAHEIARAANDSLEMALALTQMAYPLSYAADTAGALAYLRESLEISRRIGDVGSEANTRIAMGATMSHMHDFDALLSHNQRALALTEGVYPELKNYALLNIAVYYINTQQNKKAIELLKNNDTNEGQLSAPESIRNFTIGRCYQGEGEYDVARRYIEKGCAISEEIGFTFGANFCENMRWHLADALNDCENAYQHFKNYTFATASQRNAATLHKVQLRQLNILAAEREAEAVKLQAEKERQLYERQAFRNRMIGWAIGIGGLILLIFTIVISKNKVQTAEQKRRLVEEKLKVLQSQMNPHFVFNAINGIQNLILRANKLEAYEYLGKFADLLRTLTSMGQEIAIEVEDEIAFLGNYLELEKLRFRGQFTYSIEVDPKLRDQQSHIPAMMIQPLIENALVHGLSVLDRTGRLVIRLIDEVDGLRCVVRDNGRGRIAAGQKADHNPDKHLSISSENMRARFGFLRNSGYPKAGMNIEDLYDGQRADGTKVTLFLPYLEPSKHGK